MAPRWLCHGTGQNTSQRSVGSRVSAPSCHRGADYGVRRVVLEVGIEPTARRLQIACSILLSYTSVKAEGTGLEPAVWESKAHALSNLANPRYGAVNGA